MNHTVPKFVGKLFESAVYLKPLNKPIIYAEPIGADESNIPGKRCNDPGCWGEMGYSVGLVAGVYFHSTPGLASDGFGPTVKECFKAFCRTAGAVRHHPLERSVFPMAVPGQGEHGEVLLANICTFFSINAKKHYFMGAAHCVNGEHGEGWPAMFVGDYNATLLLKDVVRDIAILLSDQPATALRLRNAPLQYEEALKQPSFQLGLFTFMVFKGYVVNPWAQPSGWEKPYMLHSIYGCGGSSGGPVLDEWDRVVGVEQVGMRNFEPCSGLGGASTLEEIQAYRAYFG